MSLVHAAAFNALSEQLSGSSVASQLVDPPFERLRNALSDPDATPLDKAVLLRHVLRYESLRRDTMVDLPVPPITSELLLKCGLSVHSRVRAIPWRPSWISDGSQIVDESAMLAGRHRFFDSDWIAGDPFLNLLGRSAYRSVGQRDAVRAALAMPPGSLLIVDLPTGEGKSLIFQVVDRIGYAADPPGTRPGTTLVIVPTVTLALDHEQNAGGSDSLPMAYIGGQDSRNASIRTAIESGTQGLCFAAPEAAVASLRSALRKAASQGH